MAARRRRKVSAQKSPYYSNLVGNAVITVAAEAGTGRAVSIQLKDTSYNDLAEAGKVTAYLSRDSAGQVLLPHVLMPSGGFAIGTDGLLRMRNTDDCVFTNGTLAIDAVPEKFKTTATATFKAGGVAATKAATTALVFSTTHTITALKFGCVLIQIDKAGTVSTKVASATQAYDTAAAALAALPAPDFGKAALGYIAIENNAGDWVATTDDLTAASDVTTAAFVDAPNTGNYSQDFELVSEADGDIDLLFTHTGVHPGFYLNVELPDGSIETSSLISYAA